MRLATRRRWPSLISMTSSVGTSTSKILSCMSIDSTRLRRLARTFSSCPEYACTTYHLASVVVGLLSSLMGQCLWSVLLEILQRGRSARRVQLLDDDAEDQVGEADQRGEDEHREDDDAGHAAQLVPGRPGNL